MTLPPPSARPALKAPLGVGDIAPECALKSLDGTTTDLRDDAIAGRPLVLIFCPKFTAEIMATLTQFRPGVDAFAAVGAKLFVLTLEPARAAGEAGLSWPVLLDRSGDTFRAFNANNRDQLTTIVLRANHHVAAIFKDRAEEHASAALAIVMRLSVERQATLMAPHPPVLIVPDVMSADDCRRLISVFETRGQVFVEPKHGDDNMTTDYKMRIPEYGRGDRIDHWIVERDTMNFIDARLTQRLYPEIRRAFQYPVTRRERLRIGSYEGARGGELHGHRDNTAPIAAYRRFAMSINLNAEAFDGGELRFPEFGDQRYRPESGAAIVFSCSLLHEALHVTAGRRLVLLAFLFGDY